MIINCKICILLFCIYIIFLYKYTTINIIKELFVPTPITPELFLPYIDIIYYINLDSREDRKKLFLQEMDKMKIPKNKIERISAIYNNQYGGIGCSYSHIYTLEKFIKSSYNIAIIFEDDFEFTISKDEFIQHLHNIFLNNIQFDIICLAGNVSKDKDTEYPFLKKLINSQTTAGYIVTKDYAQNYLLNNFKEGVKQLEKNYNMYHEYAIDQYWKLLQPNHRWYITNPKSGKQRLSYSDIQKSIVDYSV